MTDWTALARSRNLAIPEDAIARITPALDALEASFKPLLTKLRPETEPAIILSESAVRGK